MYAPPLHLIRSARNGRMRPIAVLTLLGLLSVGIVPVLGAQAQDAGPKMLVPNLQARRAVADLTTPIGVAFLDDDDMLVIEKNTGTVRRVVDGVIQGTVLDLAVNFGQERGLLGIALHPEFAVKPWVYLYWTESTTGVDTNNFAQTPLLGNRVDRFIWDGSALTIDRNLIKLRAVQSDTPDRARANHNGGPLRFGPDGKLYILVGDLMRRGQLQNLPSGPTPTGQGPLTADDQFGGPEPDDAHLTGAILRLDDDGAAPSDNPFFTAGAERGGVAGANIQKLFAYGLRNSFGMAFDPIAGTLWAQENGDDSFDELNRVEAGMNGGWIQLMGPASRVAEFKAIELAQPGGPGLFRSVWPPANIADTPEEALARLFMLPGAHYSDPEFSWKNGMPLAGMGFVNGRALGSQYDGDLFVGAARPTLANGFLFHFNLSGNRENIAVDDPRLYDRVADNPAKFDLTESEDFLIGSDFGVVTDIQTGPNGNLFVVSTTLNAIYEISRVNTPPVADAGQDQVVAEGAMVTLDATGSRDPDGDMLDYWWEVVTSSGPPVTLSSNSSARPSFVASDDGRYRFKVTVRDGYGGADTAMVHITVDNVAPSITSFRATSSGLAGPLAFAPVRLTTQFTDPGADDTWTGAFTVDGLALAPVAGFVTGQSVEYQFSSPGCDKTVTVTVADDDGGNASATTTVQVGGAEFLPPLTNRPEAIAIKNGRTLPVKVRITDCAGAPLTDLTPAIRLLAANQAPEASDGRDAVIPPSRSGADTPGWMRQSEDFYIYNMQASLPTLNTDYSIVIYPYATAPGSSPVDLNPGITLRHLIRAIR